MKYKSMRSRGLGDSIEKVTRATGIKTIVEKGAKAMGKEDCGCSKRQKTLNDLFPYNKK